MLFYRRLVKQQLFSLLHVRNALWRNYRRLMVQGGSNKTWKPAPHVNQRISTPNGSKLCSHVFNGISWETLHNFLFLCSGAHLSSQGPRSQAQEFFRHLRCSRLAFKKQDCRTRRQRSLLSSRLDSRHTRPIKSSFCSQFLALMFMPSSSPFNSRWCISSDTCLKRCILGFSPHKLNGSLKLLTASAAYPLMKRVISA